METFWQKHPTLCLAFDDEFVAMSGSSDMMYAIEMYYDPRSEIAMETDDARRLEYVKKAYPDFDPTDPYVIEQQEKYLELVPELEIDFTRTLRDLRKTEQFYETQIPTTLQNAKLKTEGQAKVKDAISNLLKIRKDLTAARQLNQAVGIGNYIPSRAEQGLVGK